MEFSGALKGRSRGWTIEEEGEPVFREWREVVQVRGFGRADIRWVGGGLRNSRQLCWISRHLSKWASWSNSTDIL